MAAVIPDPTDFYLTFRSDAATSFSGADDGAMVYQYNPPTRLKLPSNSDWQVSVRELYIPNQLLNAGLGGQAVNVIAFHTPQYRQNRWGIVVLKPTHYSSFDQLIDVLTGKFPPELNAVIELKVENRITKLTINDANTVMHFTDHIATMFGLKNEELTGPGTHYGTRPADLNAVAGHYLFLSCDFVEASVVGAQSSLLLGAFLIPYEQGLAVMNLSPKKSKYVDVSHAQLSTMHFELQNEFGQPVRLSPESLSPLIMVLHFKKKAYFV